MLGKCAVALHVRSSLSKDLFIGVDQWHKTRFPIFQWLHDLKKVDRQRSWRLIFGVYPIIALGQFVKLFVPGQFAKILSPDSLRKNVHNSLIVWNIWIKFFRHIDIDEGLQNDLCYRSRLCWAQNSEKVKMTLSLELSAILWWNFSYTLVLTRSSPRHYQMPLSLVEALPRFKFWNGWNWPYLLNLLEYFDNILNTH